MLPSKIKENIKSEVYTYISIVYIQSNWGSRCNAGVTKYCFSFLILANINSTHLFCFFVVSLAHPPPLTLNFTRQEILTLTEASRRPIRAVTPLYYQNID